MSAHGSFNCFVCGDLRVVGVWQDRAGFKLLACGDHKCVRGYTFVRAYRVNRIGATS